MEANFDLFAACIEVEQDGGGERDDFTKSNDFLRDMALGLMVAGNDTISLGLTWFLWLVATCNTLIRESKDCRRDERAFSS